MSQNFICGIDNLSPEAGYACKKFLQSIAVICAVNKDFSADIENYTKSATGVTFINLIETICWDAAKLKTNGLMKHILPTKLTHLLNVLNTYITKGIQAIELAHKGASLNPKAPILIVALYASVASLYILTSPDMQSPIFKEDIIDKIILLIKYQLKNNKEFSNKTSKKIESKKKGKEVNCITIETWHHSMYEAVALLTELLRIQVFTDSALSQTLSITIMLFCKYIGTFQLPAFSLLKVIFMKYKSQQRWLFNEILVTFTKPSVTKNNIQMYNLSNGKSIQIVTAVVLSLVQCVAGLPELTHLELIQKHDNHNHVDYDAAIVNNYMSTTTVAANLVLDLFMKCNKTEVKTDQSLFEHFVQDLLTTINRPEWPAAILVLKIVGRFLVDKFEDKNVDLYLRVLALECVGLLVARLIKDANLAHNKLDEIDRIVYCFTVEESMMENRRNRQIIKGSRTDEERVVYLQQLVLKCMASKMKSDEFTTHTIHLCITQWYFEVKQNISNQQKYEPDIKRRKLSSNVRLEHNDKESLTDNNVSSDSEVRRYSEEQSSETLRRQYSKRNLATGRGRILKKHTENKEPISSIKLDTKKNEICSKADLHKKLLIRSIKLCQQKSKYISSFQTNHHCSPDMELILQFLISKGSLNKNLDIYVQHIFHVLIENNITLRMKAMKTLKHILDADPMMLSKPIFLLRMKGFCLDRSISVRESSIDLVGKFILQQPQLIDDYYDLLSMRILDTGVSVRKRVIKIFHAIWMEHPEYPKIHKMCLQMLKRINDSEGIKNLIIDIFQKMWFTPVSESKEDHSKVLTQRVRNITAVVGAADTVEKEHFEKLLHHLFNPWDDGRHFKKMDLVPNRGLLVACSQIVDCLIENVLQQRESAMRQHTVSCCNTLLMLARIQPQLLVQHIITLLPCLSLKCQVLEDQQIMVCIISMFELTVPVMDHPGELFLAQLEENMTKLSIEAPSQNVVESCLSCLGIIVNNITHNYQLIRDVFLRFYGHVSAVKKYYEINSSNMNPEMAKFKPFLRRAIFIVGLLLKHFDFSNKEVTRGLNDNIQKCVFDILLLLLKHQDDDIQLYALIAIGSVCSHHYEFMLLPELQASYQHILSTDNISLKMKLKVLFNIEKYLQEEELQIVRWAKHSDKVSRNKYFLSEPDDVSSVTANKVIPIHLQYILKCCLYSNHLIRHAVIRVIRLILQQGLVNPVQLLSHLICMSTDAELAVRTTAVKLLMEAESAYPGNVYSTIQSGMQLSYRLQTLLKGNSQVVRGYEGEPREALLSPIYKLIQKKKHHRRGVAISIIKKFDQEGCSLSELLFLSDNVAYFPYEIIDEPLFIIYQIDIVISTTGFNIFHKFQQLFSDEQKDEVNVEDQEEDQEETKIKLLARMPKDTSMMYKYMIAIERCLLLFLLREHLKVMYGINDLKISKYSFSQESKNFAKTVTKGTKSDYNPTRTLHHTSKDALGEISREAIVEQYLQLKELIHKYDIMEQDTGSS